MSHGWACYAACLEAGVPEDEVPVTAEVVSAMLTNREMNPRPLTPGEIARQAAIEAAIPRHLAAIAAELEAEAARRGGGWGRKALAALRRGQPRAEHLAEARARAAAEVDGR